MPGPATLVKVQGKHGQAEGWLTSSRISSPTGQRKCIFGCEGCLDELGHYLQCRGLAWGIAMAKSGGRRYPPGSVLARWGLCEPSDDNLVNMQLATVIYHDARHRDYVPPEDLLAAARDALRARALAKPRAGWTPAPEQPRAAPASTTAAPYAQCVRSIVSDLALPDALLRVRPLGQAMLHDRLPHRVRYPQAVGERQFGVPPLYGVYPGMANLLAALLRRTASWA
eukprot:7710686-Pyramimonas_sp.AAC.1